MGTRPRVLILELRLYGIAIDLDVTSPTLPPNLAVATVPAPLDFAVGPANHNSYRCSQESNRTESPTNRI
jgi:hypothetical protein